jgi:hypothetical protein
VPFKGGATSTDLEKANAESFTQTHRLLRRGIPFGKSLNAPESGGAAFRGELKKRNIYAR